MDKRSVVNPILLWLIGLISLIFVKGVKAFKVFKDINLFGLAFASPK